MYYILVVEDEPAMRAGLKDNLEFEGYRVDLAEDGKSGLEKITSNNYDLVILDVMLPYISGFDVCRKAREDGIDTPIILLTARGEEIDKVLGLEFGADDYITKPFSLRELLARVKAVLRRADTHVKTNPTSDFINIGKLKVNFNNYTAFEDQQTITMSHKEFELLKYLWTKQNLTVSRDDLLKDVWEQEAFTTTRTIDNFIVKLRQKVELDHTNPKIILTVHGIGYKLVNS